MSDSDFCCRTASERITRHADSGSRSDAEAERATIAVPAAAVARRRRARGKAAAAGRAATRANCVRGWAPQFGALRWLPKAAGINGAGNAGG